MRGDAQLAKLARRGKEQLYEGQLESVKPWKEAAFRLELMDRAANDNAERLR